MRGLNLKWQLTSAAGNVFWKSKDVSRDVFYFFLYYNMHCNTNGQSQNNVIFVSTFLQKVNKNFLNPDQVFLTTLGRNV